MKKVALIVLNWKQPDITIAAVDSILKNKSRHLSYHVIIVDSASPDDSLEKFKQHYQLHKSVTIIKTQGNLGYAGGNNFGIKYALKKNFDYLIIINNDVLVKEDFIEHLYQAGQKYPKAILTPKIYFAPGYEYYHDRYSQREKGKVIWSVGGRIDWQNIYATNIGIDEVDHGQYDQQSPNIDFISGCCFWASSTFFRQVGLFDDRYFLTLEDVDLTYRARLFGYRLCLVPKSVVWHLNSATTKAASPLQDYFITRNRLLFAEKHANFRTKFALFRESIRFLFTGAYWRRRGVLDYYFRRFGKGSWR